MELFDTLNALQPLSTALTDHLFSVLKEKRFSKKEFLLREGQISSNVYFVMDGAIRAYYINTKGEEITNWFMKEGDVIFSVESFLERIPSYEYIVALEDCTAYYISYDQLQSVYKEFPEFNYHGRVLTEKYYMRSLQREFLIKKKTALERYQLLLENEPHLLAMASLQDIATYLGMTPEVLSKARASTLPAR